MDLTHAPIRGSGGREKGTESEERPALFEFAVLESDESPEELAENRDLDQPSAPYGPIV